MSNGNSSGSSSGIGFFGLLTIVFIALKLTGFIDWSWWWVLLPMWAWIPLIIVSGLVCVIFVSQSKRRKRRRF